MVLHLATPRIYLKAIKQGHGALEKLNKARKLAGKENMKNTIKARLMDEQELNMVSGGWTTEQAKDIIKQCIKDENHSCIFDGIKIQLTFSTKAPIIGDLMPELIKGVASGECAKNASGGGFAHEAHKLGSETRSILATFKKA